MEHKQFCLFENLVLICFHILNAFIAKQKFQHFLYFPSFLQSLLEKGLVSKIYKHLMQINIQKQTTQLKDDVWQKPIQYCKVKNKIKNLKIKKKKDEQKTFLQRRYTDSQEEDE